MLILASASPARASLLSAAGIAFTAESADFDETDLKRFCRKEGKDALSSTLELAAEKARRVSARHPGALVVGADQILDAGDHWLDKPRDLSEAREQLYALRANTHELLTGACAVVDGKSVWRTATLCRLKMRPFSEAYLDAYIDAEGEALLGAVGAYRLEGRGVQLFERIEGDHFSILGLPLIELLAFLRERGTIAS